MQLKRLVLFVMLMAIVEFSACKRQSSAHVLTISAASSLQPVMTVIATQWARLHPGAKIRFNFAASGVLATQIQQGAPVDVFLSAAPNHVARLGRLAAAAVFARNEICLASTASQVVTTLSALRSRGIRRLAIGNPRSVPVGQYAKALLISKSLWTQLKKKIVYGENARQVVDWVARGEVDAALVFCSDTARIGQHLVRRLHSSLKIRYYALAIQKSPRSALWIRYLQSPAVRKILARYSMGVK